MIFKRRHKLMEMLRSLPFTIKPENIKVIPHNSPVNLFHEFIEELDRAYAANAKKGSKCDDQSSADVSILGFSPEELGIRIVGAPRSEPHSDLWQKP